MIKCEYNLFSQENDCPVMGKLSSLTDFVLSKAKKFTAIDFAIIKLCLVSMGIFIGAKFSDFLRKYSAVFVSMFIVSYFYLIYRIFFIEDD